MHNATKALPNRQPETAAAKHANRMMTHGGAPLPVRTIQQNGAFCPACGEHHRPGNTCGVKAMGDFFDTYFGKANPYHDERGRFTTAKNATNRGGGGDSGMAHLTGGASAAAPAAGSGGTMVGKKPSAPAAAAPAGAPATSPGGPNTSAAAHAQTMQATAPAAAGAPAVPSAGGGGAEQKTGVGVAPKRAQANQARREGMQQAASSALDQQVGAMQSKLGGDEPRTAGEAAYKEHHAKMLAQGASPDEAHEAAKQHGIEAWDAAVRTREAGKQAAPTGPRQNIPGAGAAPTQQQHGPPTGMGPPKNPTSVPLSPMTQQGAAAASGAPGAPAAQAAPPGGQQPPGAAQPGTPGAPGGAKPQAGKQGQAGGIQPWSMYGVGSGIGGGMFTPGGTVGATAGGAVNTAHQLLHGNGNQQRQPAAVGRQQRLAQNAKPQSPKMQGSQSSQQVHP